MKKIIIILISTVTIVMGQSKPLTIYESLQIGLNSNKSIKITNSETIVSDAHVTNAWSNLLPKVSLGLNYNHISTMPIQMNLPLAATTGDGSVQALYTSATIEQPLFTGFRLLSVKKASELNKQASIAENSKAKNDVAWEIHQAFWNYSKTLKFVEVLEENLDLIKSQMKNVENFVKTGMATRNDLLKLKVAEADVKSKIIDAQNQSKIAQANFNRVIGLKINNNTQITIEEHTEEISELNFDSVLNEALDTRLELLANNFRIQAAGENITVAKSTWYPQISAAASYNYLKLNGSNLLNDEPNNFWMVGVGIKWNIWDWWKTSSNVTIAEQQRFQIDVTNKIIMEKIEIEVYSNYLTLESESNKIELNKLRVESAEENYRITNDKFNAKVATSSELTEASTLLAEAKITLITSSIDYKLARIKLDKSIGRKIY